MRIFVLLPALWITTATVRLPAADISDLTWTTAGGEVTITDCKTAASGELVIPDTIKGKPVTSIGGGAFYKCTALTSITIPDSVTSIGNFAFVDCTRLKSVTIPDSVTSIGGRAFMHCARLTSITIPDSVISIGTCAFSTCTGLTSITIPDSVTSIESGAFAGCNNLISITIGANVTNIGLNYFEATRNQRFLFFSCDALTSITFLGDVVSPGRPPGRPFSLPSGVTIYRKPEAKGWGDKFAGRPVKLISEKP